VVDAVQVAATGGILTVDTLGDIFSDFLTWSF